jgi:predicted nucleic acid-binding protein
MQIRFEKLLDSYTVISLDNSISQSGISLYKKYKLSHGLDMPDFLIAATAIELDLPLFTYNTKDFRSHFGQILFPFFDKLYL